jgi:hypothetical protein
MSLLSLRTQNGRWGFSTPNHVTLLTRVTWSRREIIGSVGEVYHLISLLWKVVIKLKLKRVIHWCHYKSGILHHLAGWNWKLFYTCRVHYINILVCHGPITCSLVPARLCTIHHFESQSPITGPTTIDRLQCTCTSYRPKPQERHWHLAPAGEFEACLLC